MFKKFLAALVVIGFFTALFIAVKKALHEIEEKDWTQRKFIQFDTNDSAQAFKELAWIQALSEYLKFPIQRYSRSSLKKNMGTRK